MDPPIKRPEIWFGVAGLAGLAWVIDRSTFNFFFAVGCLVIACSLVVIGRRKNRKEG